MKQAVLVALLFMAFMSAQARHRLVTRVTEQPILLAPEEVQQTSELPNATTNEPDLTDAEQEDATTNEPDLPDAEQEDATTNEPDLPDAEEEEEKRDMDINIWLDAILALPDQMVPPAVKSGIKSLLTYADPLQGLIKQSLSTMNGGIKPGIDLLIQFIQKLKKLVAGAGGGVERIRGEVGQALGTVLNFLVKNKRALGGLISSTIAKLKRVGGVMTKQVAAFGRFLINGLKKILVLIKETIIFKFTVTASEMMKLIRRVIGMLTGRHGLLRDALENVLEDAEGTAINFLTGLRRLIAFATKESNPLLSHLVNLLGTVGSLLGPAMTSILMQVFKVVRGPSSSG